MKTSDYFLLTSSIFAAKLVTPNAALVCAIAYILIAAAFAIKEKKDKEALVPIKVKKEGDING